MNKFTDNWREAKLKQSNAQQQRLDQQAHKALDKYGLNVSEATTATIKQFNADNIRKIASEMRGNGLIKAGLTFGGSATERAQLGYLSALTEQNWVLIRQNELIIRLLDKGTLDN